MIYINSFDELEVQSERNILLGWVISNLQNQYGFSHMLAQIGKDKFGTEIFDKLLAKRTSLAIQLVFVLKKSKQ